MTLTHARPIALVKITQESCTVLEQYLKAASIRDVMAALSISQKSARAITTRLLNRRLIQVLEKNAYRASNGMLMSTYLITALGRKVMEVSKDAELPSKAHGKTKDEIELAPFDAGWTYKVPNPEVYFSGASIDV